MRPSLPLTVSFTRGEQLISFVLKLLNGDLSTGVGLQMRIELTETDRKSTNCFRSCREVASNDGRVYCHHRHLLPDPKKRHSSLSIGFSGTCGHAAPLLMA